MVRFNKNILFVEDETGIRQAVEKVLDMVNGKTVVSCEDWQQGLEAFKNNSFDLVITDIRMPNMNGVELAEKIREVNSDVPILFITGDPYKLHEERIVKLGNTFFTSKPTNIPKLIDLLQGIFE